MRQSIFILIVLFVSLLLLVFDCNAQDKKWYTITNNDLLIIGTGIVAGTADGLHELINTEQFMKGDQFWDKTISWKNKYKDFDGGDKSARFIGSKTVFVFLTDGYHLTRTIDRTFMYASVGIAAGELNQYPKDKRIFVILKKIALSYISNRIAFNLTFQNLKTN